MNLKSAFIVFALTILLLVSVGGPGPCQGQQVVTVCQELVNLAASYDARASYHRQVAKAYTIHIESLAKLPKNTTTIQAMDNFFALYDQNRALEAKFKDLYRQTSEEAKRCMKSVE
jgi:hypothetical protein